MICGYLAAFFNKWLINPNTWWTNPIYFCFFGICPTPFGICTSGVGICPTRVGICHTQVGICPTQVGICTTCVSDKSQKKKNLGFVHHELGFVTQVRRTSPIKKWDLSYMTWDLYYTFWCIMWYKSQMFLTYPIFCRTSRLPFFNGFLRRQNNLSSSCCALHV